MKTSISRRLFLLVCITFTFASTAFSQSVAEVFLNQILKANGFDRFKEVKEIEFTFAVKLPNKEVSRGWLYKVAVDSVFLNGEAVAANDSRWVNDSYWLFFPLKISHSLDQVELTLDTQVVSPLGKETCTSLQVKYTSDQGYTPGDTYRLYVDKSFKVIEWDFVAQSDESKKRSMVWSDYQVFGPLSLSLHRSNPAIGFDLKFLNVRVR